MATALPTVTVAPVEAGHGFTITCNRCPFQRLRPSRPQADLVARDHRASHQTPDPADQVTALDDFAEYL